MLTTQIGLQAADAGLTHYGLTLPDVVERKYGDTPSEPRNVIVSPASSCSPDKPDNQRPSDDPDPDPDYDWNDCHGWNVSWDTPSDHGGWAIRKYNYGHVVYRTSYDAEGRFPPGRYCNGDGWPWRAMATNHSYIRANPQNGRRYGFDFTVNLPRYWTIGMTAVNGRGESECEVPEPTFRRKTVRPKRAGRHGKPDL